MTRRTTSEIREDFAREMDRLRQSDLSDFENFSANVSFHLGYLNSTIYELLNRVEGLERQAGMFTPKGGL